MKKNVKLLALCLLVPLAGGGLVGWLSGTADGYKEFIKPPFSPPGWLFPAAWSILYLLMGYALYRALTASQDGASFRSALTVFAFQLALNYLWPVIFFGIGAYWAAAVCLLALIVFIIFTMVDFSRSDGIAAKLLIPYLLWCLFAMYLNIGVAVLN